MIPFWYIIIAILWTGFFVLEGFDFGVGMLHSIIGTDEAGRRAAINTIGPLWDGNEVWLIVAGAGMFAAFPGWYATMFSAYNLALVLLLASLIVRGVAFEYRGKRDAARWRRTWDVLLTVGSVLAPLLIGVALAGLLHGLPINSAQNYTGSFWDLLQPYALFTGVTLVLVCLLHGATFLCLKTTDQMRERSWKAARRVAPVTAAAVVGFIIWTHVTAGTTFFLNVIELLAVIAVIAAAWLVYAHSEGFAFAATTVTIASCILALFVDLYPNVMVSSTSKAYNLTVQNTASNPYSLKVMTVVVIIFLPLVLGYQTWTYYVFRRRVSRQEFRPPHLPGTPSPAVPEKRDHEFPAEVQGTLMTTPSDPLALQRSKSYRAPLMLAAIIGVPISAAAYFLLSRRGQQDAGVDLHRPAQGRGLPIRTAVVADPAAGAGRAAGRSHHPVPATQGRPLASRPAQGRRRPSRAGR
jgi:cytochrome d ubiquinol oxidase subunit II